MENTLDEIKTELLNYTDFFGGSILDSHLIKSATTKDELREIVDRHNDFLSDQANDAQHSLERFKRKIGL